MLLSITYMSVTMFHWFQTIFPFGKCVWFGDFLSVYGYDCGHEWFL